MFGMLHVLYNVLLQQSKLQKNVIKEIMRENTLTILYLLEKKSMYYKRTHGVQTPLVLFLLPILLQGSIIHGPPLQYSTPPCIFTLPSRIITDFSHTKSCI